MNVTSPVSPTLPQPAVGSHRVWATEIVSMLLAPNHQAVDNLVASCKLVPKVLAISLGHPLCSALHTRALRILRSCCVSKVAGLYGPLFTAGMGAGLTVGEGGELCPSLQQQLADRGECCWGRRMLEAGRMSGGAEGSMMERGQGRGGGRAGLAKRRGWVSSCSSGTTWQPQPEHLGHAAPLTGTQRALSRPWSLTRFTPPATLRPAAALAVGVPSGRRDRSVGFVLEACKVLRACCDEANRDSILNTNVRRLLQVRPLVKCGAGAWTREGTRARTRLGHAKATSRTRLRPANCSSVPCHRAQALTSTARPLTPPANHTCPAVAVQMDAKWSDFVSEGGVLSQLCKEQEGDLGGPRAARVQMEDSNELAELAGGGLISSHEILALLHGMGALGMSPGSGGN